MSKRTPERFTSGDREYVLTATVSVHGLALSEAMGGEEYSELLVVMERAWERVGELPEVLEVARKHGIAGRKRDRLIGVARQEESRYIRSEFSLPMQGRGKGNLWQE